MANLRNYEGLFMIKPEMEQEEVKQMYQKIQGNIKKYGATIEGVEEWGKKKLATAVKKHSEAYYYLVRFSMEPDKMEVLSNDIKLNELILRSIFTVTTSAGKI